MLHFSKNPHGCHPPGGGESTEHVFLKIMLFLSPDNLDVCFHSRQPSHLPTILSATTLPTETMTVVHSVPTQGQKQAKCFLVAGCIFQNKTQMRRKPFLSIKFTPTIQSFLINSQTFSFQPLSRKIFAERYMFSALPARTGSKLSCSALLVAHEHSRWH